MMREFRYSDRCIIDSKHVVKIVWDRLKSYLPKDLLPGTKAVGINERLRFLRYDKGMYFKSHCDGSYYEKGSNPPKYSLVTLQLYLNKEMKGGATTFMGKDEKNHVAVQPKTGLALLFDHDIEHEGSLLEEGRKYAVRTDVMYEEIQL